MPRTRQPNQPPQHLALETEGQRLLRAVPGGHAQIGAAVGVSAMTISRWRAGHLRPSDECRASLAAMYSIPAESWNRASTRAAKAMASHRTSALPRAVNGAQLAGPADESASPNGPDLTDDECARLDDGLRLTLARRGVTLPCDPSEVLAAWQRDPWPSATDFAPSAPATPCRRSKGPPTHPWVIGCMRKEVAQKGYEATRASYCARGGYEDEFLAREDI